MLYLPDNQFLKNKITSKVPNNFILPTYTRLDDNNLDTIDYERNDPSILLSNPQNPLHIINPEYERGGFNTRDYVKLVYGTPLEYTIRVPFNSTRLEPEPIKSAYLKKLGKDSPAEEYKNLLNFKTI